MGEIRSALVVAALTLFIALSPWWDRALVTYNGNFWCSYFLFNRIYSWNIMFSKQKICSIYARVCDIFQTFPSFVYLIPVMMLFGITDTSVLIAVIVYATIPATKYTMKDLEVFLLAYMKLQQCLV
ncbi:MAG: hypothetical protein CM1200mP13_04480 [Candidatus Pelagibacterales bacterium]|nr:MAG: hypothetical protein CM1200mP13_04480 [Pelagibacterales bacterium]